MILFLLPEVAIMYGQKQIIQCAAVAIVLFILSFHRSALKQNREMVKAKLRRSEELQSKSQTQPNSDVVRISGKGYDLAFNSSLNGYCLRAPFGGNIFGNYDNNVTHCHHICFDTFEVWLHRQCKADCCGFKSIVSVTRSRQLNIDSMQKSTTRPTRRTHGITALIVYI